jgi:TolA-binding protein
MQRNSTGGRIFLAALCAALLAPFVAGAQGIDLSGGDTKKDAKKGKEKPAPTMSFEAIDVSGKSAGKQRLDAAQKLFQEKSYETAALAFHEILKDPALGEDHEQARYLLAKTLARMGLYHSSLQKFNDILNKGAQGSKFFRTSLEWLFFIGKRTVNEQIILNEIARFSKEQFPPKYNDKFHYLLAKYYFERAKALEEAGQAAEAKKSYDESRRLLATVKPDADEGPAKPGDDEDEGEDGNTFAKAKFLEGMIHYAEKRFDGALDAFKEVVRLTNPRTAKHPNQRLRELSFLQLARLHYEHKQNRYAIFYYNKMPWGGENWLEGLWESSYAHYRIGDYERALGNLITLHSPFFKEDYFPESYILKAIIYYENCRYREARAILEDFNGIYEPVYAELQKITGKNTAPSAYFDMLEEAEKNKDRGEHQFLMRKILKLAFTDKTIKKLNDSILEIETEMDKGIGDKKDAFRYSDLSKDLLESLKKERQQIVEEAGGRARQKLEYERDALKELLSQALRIKIEVNAQERKFLEMALQKGGAIDVVKKYKFSVAVSDEHQYWPYEGEFWRDELGTYSYTLTKGCKESPGGRSQAAR